MKKKSPKANKKPLTRKELRKEKRLQKKARRHDYYTNRTKPGKYVLNPELNSISGQKQPHLKDDNDGKPRKPSCETQNNKVMTTEELIKKERREQKKLEKEMMKQRSKQLIDANLDEDKNIRQLEKQLKLNKRKSKSVPKSFAEDGLDYLLEVCDSDNLKNVASAEQQMNDFNDDFEEDFQLMSGRKLSESDPEVSLGKRKRKENKNKRLKKLKASEEAELSDNLSEDEFDDLLGEDDALDLEEEDLESLGGGEIANGSAKDESEDAASLDEAESDAADSLGPDSDAADSLGTDSDAALLGADSDAADSLGADSDAASLGADSDAALLGADSDAASLGADSDAASFGADSDAAASLGADSDEVDSNQKGENGNLSSNDDDIQDVDQDSADDMLSEDGTNLQDDDKDIESDGEDLEDIKAKGASKLNADGTWEDIYGRLRDKDGNVVQKVEGKYIPPAIRAKMENEGSTDQKRIEKLNRLKKQLKGLLNRLAETNMHGISSTIEGFYMSNSRNDMNETLTNLIFEAVITNVTSPERLLMEHILLVIILHANVGTEVGAHFLQSVVKKFDDLHKSPQPIDDKTLDNAVNVLAQLYNFKLFDAKLIYEIIHRLAARFQEKDIECILHILKSVGFNLRKDDPLMLKSVILELQKQAACSEIGDNARVKFLLDVLLAIKNNNVSKIPNYDTSYSEHLKKILKGFIRKGNYVTQLNITLDDLLKAEEKGRWWVVGSAWTGKTDNGEENETRTKEASGFSQKLLELAKKQRMNTDTRRNIFCIIMSAEDYLDAYEKLLHLGLKNTQEREIIHVILHCCLSEKKYNPYYAILAQKFCDYDRKFQMAIKFSVWDKVKALDDHSATQIANLAKLLTHLFIEKGLPISTLKIIQFSELDKVTLRFIRQILLGILLHEDLEAVQGVFERVAVSDKLKMFRESLRLFIHHFLLRNAQTDKIDEAAKELLKQRAQIVEKILSTKDKLKY